MAYRKATLRRMPPKTRAIARLVNDLESVTRRLKNQIPIVEQLEIDARALFNRHQLTRQQNESDHGTRLGEELQL